VWLSSSNNLPKIAGARKTDPAKLLGLVRGETDWIVMKCLEKDRSQHYDSPLVGGLSAARPDRSIKDSALFRARDS
jgi:hypothetical protein